MYQAVPPGPVVYVPVTSDSTSVVISGLNGETDGNYRIGGYLILPINTTPTITIRPNGLTDNLSCLVSGTAAAAAVTPSVVALLYFDGFTTAASGTPFIRFANATFTAKTGSPRYWELLGQSYTGTAPRRLQCHGIWADTTTPITSFTIFSDTASAIKAGSWISIEKTGVNS